MGADHLGLPLKRTIRAQLEAIGDEVVDHGVHASTPVDYPDIAVEVARDVAARVIDRALLRAASVSLRTAPAVADTAVRETLRALTTSAASRWQATQHQLSCTRRSDMPQLFGGHYTRTELLRRVGRGTCACSSSAPGVASASTS